MMRLAATLFLLVASVLGCTVGDDPECIVGADCASGVCLVNGRCEAPQISGAGDASMATDVGTTIHDAGVTVDAGASDAGGPNDAGSIDARPPRDAGTQGCLPNHDGVIEAYEAPTGAGRAAPFLVATDVDVDTAGTVANDGAREWSLPRGLPGDHSVTIATESLGGQWYASVFPTATYASRLSERGEELGIFQVTSNALLLLGVVSPWDGVTRTELEFDPPVQVLSFPLRVGHRWTTDAHVTGLYNGLVSNYFELYESEVDAAGRLETPYGTFPVLRVKTRLDRVVGLLTTVVRQFAFASECFGVVGMIVSQDNETREEFTDAAEVRRLTP